MKNIFISLFIFKSVIQFGQIPWIYNSSGNTNLSSGTTNIRANAINIGATSYQVSSSAVLSAKALTQIQVQPGFQVSGLTSGSALLKIDSDILTVASFHPNGFNGIPTYDRFEVGVKLPPWVQGDINNFLATLTNGVGRINPYDPDQIKIFCAFTHINSNQTYWRNGFYYRDYMVGPGDPGHSDKWFEQNTDYPYRIRFAPPLAGAYKASVALMVNNIMILNSDEFTFNVTSQSINKGHLSMTGNPDIQKMRYDNGDIFFAVGRNIAFADHDLNNSNGANNLYGYWWEKQSSPNSHAIHRACLSDLGDNGGNFARVRLDEWSVPIETMDLTRTLVDQHQNIGQFLVNYHHNQPFMWEMDKTLAKCEEKNVHLMLNLLGDWLFDVSNDTLVDDDLSDLNNPLRTEIRFWRRNPYRALLGATLAGRNQFFTDLAPKATFKKRLYYIEARWGYSTSIAMWEMINETENIHKYNDGTYPNLKSDIGNWLCEMRSYLQTFYPSHPVTNGTVKLPDFDPNNPNTSLGGYSNTYSSCLDVFSSNAYFREWDQTNNRYDVGRVGGVFSTGSNELLDLVANAHSRYWFTSPSGKKPFIWGEINLLGDIANYSDFSFHDIVWTSIFSNAIGTGMYWTQWTDPYIPGTPNHTNEQFKAVRAFVDKIDFNQLLLPDRNIISPSWRPLGPQNLPLLGPPFLSYIVNEPSFGPSLTYWLRTTDRKTVYGWSRNTTANWSNDGYSDPFLPASFKTYLDVTHGSGNPPAINPSSPTTLNNSIIVQNLLPNSFYDVEIYDSHNINAYLLETQLGVPTNNIGILVFGRAMPTFAYGNNNSSYYYPDYAFIAKLCEEETCEGGGGEGRMMNPNHEDPTKLDGDKTLISKESEKTLNKKTEASSRKGVKNIERVSPVPTFDKVFVNLNKNDWQNPRALIVDAIGRTVEIEIGTDNSINVSEFANGFYTLKIVDASREKSFKVVIQH